MGYVAACCFCYRLPFMVAVLQLDTDNSSNRQSVTVLKVMCYRPVVLGGVTHMSS